MASDVSPVECIHYALDLPTSTVVNGIDSMERLTQVLTAVRTFAPLSPTRVSDLLSKTAAAGESGRYELYKMSDDNDSTSRNPRWLG